MDVLNTHLPRIVDLASNFNIDLKDVLTEYCQKLRDNVPEFMDTFSFPQAALLLQHCAEIYGRKVDYVYNLTLELCELMNVRLYEPGADRQNDAEPVDAIVLPKKATLRRRKTTAALMTEDFQFVEFSLGKPKVVEKKFRRKRHVRECGLGRFVVITESSNQEHLIYEDSEFASIGPKNQFRVNWHMLDNCAMEESIMDRGSGSSWAVCDVGISNMPTPEYSDDGHVDSVHDVTGHDVSGHVDSVHVSEHLAVSEAMVTVPEVIVSLAPVQPPLDDVKAKSLSSEKPVTKSNFKLPYELTKKGQREAKPEPNITLFLFSNMLKRSLKMNGVIPPSYNKKCDDKQLVLEHINYLQRRFNLDKRRSQKLCLTEHQPDFLGFEEEILPEVRGVLSTDYDASPLENGNEEPASPQGSFEDDGAGNDLAEDPCEEIVKHFQNNQKASFDEVGVANWRTNINKKLSSVEKLRPFDVHQYSTDIIDAFQDVGETVSFGEMVGGLGAGECARYFVSTLMLANTSNLLLDNNGPNTLKLTLQSRERHHEMEMDLVPPSAGGIEARGHAPNCHPQSSNLPSNQADLETPIMAGAASSKCNLIDLIEAGSSVTPTSSPVTSVTESLMSDDGRFIRKRGHDDDHHVNSVSNDGIESLGRRYCKQIPGAGPWVNKSKKRLRAE